MSIILLWSGENYCLWEQKKRKRKKFAYAVKIKIGKQTYIKTNS